MNKLIAFLYPINTAIIYFLLVIFYTLNFYHQYGLLGPWKEVGISVDSNLQNSKAVKLEKYWNDTL